MHLLWPGSTRPVPSLLTLFAEEPGHAIRPTGAGVKLMNLATGGMQDVPQSTTPFAVFPALGTGWIATSFWNNGTGKPITRFQTTWKVPPAPTTSSGQLIYLFNGITRFSSNSAILQPVLQWGTSPDGGGLFWAIASWYVHTTGQAFYTPLVKVNPGDTVIGVMTLTNQAAGKFDYAGEFQGVAGTKLPVQNIEELLWCSETLEAYGITKCTDYPNVDFTAFRAISIQTGTVTPAIAWGIENTVTDCGQHAVVVSNSATNGEVDIYYRTPQGGVGTLAFIKTANTPTGHVEVHLASGSSGYQTRILETATTFGNETDGVWQLLPNQDLVFIKTNNTPNSHVEVHIASRASNYQTRILEIATTFGNETDGVWQLLLNLDLAFIKTANTPSGHVEVHIASRASNYLTRMLVTATTFGNETDGVWQLLPNLDLAFIKTSNTPTSHVEVHIASRASNYQTRILETTTTFADESDGVWKLLPNLDLAFIKTSNTPNGHVEVHIASRASNYQTRTVELPTTFVNESDGTWSLLLP